MKALLEREFVVASKQKRLYFVRFILALVFGYIMLMGVGISATSGNGGGQMYASMITATFFLVSLFILAQTSGCISDERRQGTLGLLLLTPLQAWHVVFGKFAAHFLEGFQIFLAILPMLFLPYAIGGLMFGQMATSFMVIFSQMILCVAFSLLGSAFFRSGAMTFMVSDCVIFGLETLGSMIVHGNFYFTGPFHPAFTYINPMATAFQQFQMTSGNLLGSLVTLGTTIVMAVIAFIVAAIQVSRLAAGDISFAAWKWPFQLRYKKTGSRPDWLAPIFWLHSERKMKINLVVFVVCCGTIAYTFWMGKVNRWVIFPLYVGSVLLYLSMSLSLIQRMQADKEERIFELIFVSPISHQEWLSQIIKASWAVYGLPVLMMSSAALVSMMYDQMVSGSVWSIISFVLGIGNFLANWYFLTIMSLFYGIKSRRSIGAFGTVLCYWVVTFSFCIPMLLQLVIPMLLQLVIAKNQKKILQEDMRRMLTEEIY